MRRLILTLLASIFSAVAATPASAEAPMRYDDHMVVRIQVDRLADLRLIEAISADIWNCHVGLGLPLDVMVTPKQREELDEAGLSYDVVIPDVQAKIDAERANVRGASFFDDYQRLTDVFDYMDTLIALRPDLASSVTLGQSLEGRDIRGLRISGPGSDPRPGVFYHGGQHAREWITVPVTMYIADQLIRNYDTDPQIKALVDSVEWFIVPVMNPDGYEYTHTNQRLWRKNRRNNGNGTFGVDLNRNWGFQWGTGGSSADPSSDIYRGPAPFSEPETQVMRDFVLAHPNIVAHLDNHSYSQLLLYPWGYTTALSPDDAEFDEISSGMVSMIQSISGRNYVNGPIAPTLYVASGSSVDWMYGERGIFSMTYEFRDTGASGFLLPTNQIIPNCEEIFPTILFMTEQITTPMRIKYPNGTPGFIDPGSTFALRIDIENNAETLDPSTATLYVRSDPGDSFAAVPMTSLGGDAFEAVIPAADCGDVIEYYAQATSLSGSVVRNPVDAPASVLESDVRDLAVAFSDDFESDLGWTVSGGATDGQWSRGVPVDGDRGDPPSDSDGSGQCWVTDNVAGNSDVDGGATILTSPLLDGSGGGFLSYDWWLDSGPGVIDSADYLRVEFSIDEFGTIWSPVREYTTPEYAWRSDVIDIEAEVGTPSMLRVRFVAADLGAGSVVEAGVDNIRFETVEPCPPPPACEGDADGDLSVDFADLNIVLTNWGASGPDGDLDQSGAVDFDDLNVVLTNWGANCL